MALSLATSTCIGGAAEASSRAKIDLTVPAPDDGVEAWSQTAASGSLSGTGQKMLLRLKDVSDSIVGIAEQPSRAAGTVGARAFYSAWDDRFGADPPNAVLTYTPPGAERPRTTALTVDEPKYDAATDVVTYQVEAPADYDPAGTAAAMPNRGTFRSASLLIDDAETRDTSAESAITFANDIPRETSAQTEFRMFQGDHLVSRLGVPAGKSERVPTTTEYTAQAFTTMGQFSLSSNSVSFSDTSVTLQAQILQEAGQYDFQLIVGPGTQASAITCENTTASSVKFRLQKPNSPFEIVTVVDENNDTVISTAQTWTVYAIVNGVTSATVTVTDPNARVTASPSGESGVTLTVT